MNSLQMIESILTEGKVSSTYKYALLVSIIDYTIDNPLQTPRNNFHFIPIFELSKRFIGYYFPLILDNVRQGSYTKSKTGIALEKYINRFIDEASKGNEIQFSLRQPENTYKLYSYIEEGDNLSKNILELLFDIRKAILDQPIRYVNNIGSRKISLFGIFTRGVAFEESFETHLEHGLKLSKRKIMECNTFDELLNNEICSLFIGHQTYSELSKYRFLLRDVILKRWSEVTFERFKCKNTDILYKFDLWKHPVERDTYSIMRYKTLYQKLGLTNCIYCGKSLKGGEYHIDHLLPWSRLPIDKFWNLYPACKTCNLKKSDRIPILDGVLVDRIKNHLRLCIELLERENKIIARDLEQLYSRTFNSQYQASNIPQVTEEIFEYLKSLSVNMLELIPEYAFAVLNS